MSDKHSSKIKMIFQNSRKQRRKLLTWGANTLIFRSVIDAGGSVLTSSVSASVVLVLTSDSGVSGRTGAIETGAKVATESSVHARTANATLWCSLASFTVCTLRATEK